MNQLHIDSISKHYEGKQILTDVFLSCQVGEIVGLLGRNGSGKSTLLKIIFGAVSAESKFIKLDNIINPTIFESRNLLSYLAQDNFIPPDVKLSKLFPLLCDSKYLDFVLTHELITPVLSNTAQELSGGQIRVVEIFLIIFSKAKYILLDEPFNGVAPIYKEVVKELIVRQSAEKAFIITDHDYRNVLDVSTRLILMHDGGTKPIKGEEGLREWGYIS